MGVPERNSPMAFLAMEMTPTHNEKVRPTIMELSVVGGIPVADPKTAPHRVLNTMAIVGLCYFAVSGGPIGSEQIISGGGPLIGMVSLFIWPIITSIPMAYITAELSTTFPEDGGYTIWVLNAFGPFWAFQTGFWSLVANVVDNAIYPAVAVATFTEVYGEIGGPFVTYLIKATVAILLALPNFFGQRLVGGGMIGLTVFVMIPFIVLSIMMLAKANSWGSFDEIRLETPIEDEEGNVIGMEGQKEIQWSVLINVLFWNFNGFTNMSVFGGEVANPGKTYPRAMIISVILVVLTYLIPLFAATAFNTPHWSTWEEGSFSEIADAAGGSFMSGWIMLATFASNTGMYITYLFCNSFQMLGMAECGLAPRFLERRSERFGTPQNASLVCLFAVLCLVSFDFESILAIENALSALSQLLLMGAFIRLRYTHAEVERPVKVPGSIPILYLMLVIPAAVLVVVSIDSFMTLETGIIVGAVIIVGIIYAKVKNFSRSQFENLRLSEA